MSNPSEQTEREQAVRELAEGIVAHLRAVAYEWDFSEHAECEGAIGELIPILRTALTAASRSGAERMREAAAQISHKAVFDFLSMHTEQRAYSWHDVADAMKEAMQAIRAIEPERPAGTCQGCGGPHPFDTTVPSDLWNAVIRAKKLPEFLCLTCIVREFVKAGKDFTAELWGETFNGAPLTIGVERPASQNSGAGGGE